MTSYPVAPTGAAPATKPGLPDGASTATCASTAIATSGATRASAAVLAAAGTKRPRLTFVANYPAPGVADRRTLATVTELHPGNRTDGMSRLNRSAIRALKRSYLRRARLFASDAGMATAE